MNEKLVALTRRTISAPVAEYATYKDRLDNQTIVQLGSDSRCYFVRGVTIKDDSLEVILETVNPWDGPLVPSTPELEAEFANAKVRFQEGGGGKEFDDAIEKKLLEFIEEFYWDPKGDQTLRILDPVGPAEPPQKPDSE